MNQDKIDKLVQAIADELFTTSYGTPHQTVGTRLAVMQGKWPDEKNLGGRTRASVEKVLRRHLEEAP